MNHPRQSDFQYPSPEPLQQVWVDFPALPPPPQPPPATDFLAQGLTQKQRKKRTKLIPVNDDNPGTSTSSAQQKKKYSKPDPAAPKITRPCTECGKKFWSWKALFGHMRCHPERQWRGINPPPSVRPSEAAMAATAASSSSISRVEMTEEDHEVAASLLLLANGGQHGFDFGTPETAYDSAIVVIKDGEDANSRFECSSCKKVFGSHQALGGHRASHKNVKGCFANARFDEEEEEEESVIRDGGDAAAGGGPGPSSSSMALIIRHCCTICSKVFSTGQALGGHMRCHWDKTDDPQCATIPSTPAAPSRPLDLNFPASLDPEPPSSCSSSALRLDLRLGL